MRYWSEVDGVWVEVDVIWDGSTRLPIPGIGSFDQRGNYLLDAAPSHGSHKRDFLDLNSRGSELTQQQRRRLNGLCGGCSLPSADQYYCEQCRIRRGHTGQSRADYLATRAKRELAELAANPDAIARSGRMVERRKCQRRCGRKVSRGDTKAGFVLCATCRAGLGRTPTNAA